MYKVQPTSANLVRNILNGSPKTFFKWHLSRFFNTMKLHIIILFTLRDHIPV